MLVYACECANDWACVGACVWVCECGHECVCVRVCMCVYECVHVYGCMSMMASYRTGLRMDGLVRVCRYLVVAAMAASVSP